MSQLNEYPPYNGRGTASGIALPDTGNVQMCFYWTASHASISCCHKRALQQDFLLLESVPIVLLHRGELVCKGTISLILPAFPNAIPSGICCTIPFFCAGESPLLTHNIHHFGFSKTLP